MDGDLIKKITNIGWGEILGDHFGEIMETLKSSKEKIILVFKTFAIKAH